MSIFVQNGGFLGNEGDGSTERFVSGAEWQSASCVLARDEDFSGLDLGDPGSTNRHGTRLSNSSFEGCDFSNVRFYGGRWGSCLFRYCDFTGADMCYLDIHACVFEECTFKRIRHHELRLVSSALYDCTLDESLLAALLGAEGVAKDGRNRYRVKMLGAIDSGLAPEGEAGLEGERE